MTTHPTVAERLRRLVELGNPSYDPRSAGVALWHARFDLVAVLSAFENEDDACNDDLEVALVALAAKLDGLLPSVEEIAELRADKERLDWLDASVDVHPFYRCGVHPSTPLRAAIDARRAARTEEKKP